MILHDKTKSESGDCRSDDHIHIVENELPVDTYPNLAPILFKVPRIKAATTQEAQIRVSGPWRFQPQSACRGRAILRQRDLDHQGHARARDDAVDDLPACRRRLLPDAENTE